MAALPVTDQRIEVRRSPVPHVVVDGLFGGSVVDAMLAHLVELEADFRPAGIGEGGRASAMRQNLTLGIDERFTSRTTTAWTSRS